MSEIKHTPGPWVVGVGVDNGLPCVDAPDAGNIEICECWGAVTDKVADDQSRANARLIAAAPELLEVLEAVLADGLTRAAIRKARAAIAKARGVA